MGNEGISAAKRTSTSRAVFENSLVGIFTTTKDRIFSAMNHKAAVIFGFSPVELIGQSARLVHASDESFLRFGEEVIAALPERAVVRLHYQLLRKDGSLFLAEVSGSPLNGVDLEDGIVWVIADVTAQREGERAAQRSAGLVHSISQAALDGLVMMDHEGQVASWNPAAERMFGYSEEEILGQPLHAVLCPEVHPGAFEENWPTFLETGKGNAIGKAVELLALHKDGHEFPVELSLSGTLQDGKWWAVGVVHDISDRKKADAELRESERRHRTLLEDYPGIAYEANMETWAPDLFEGDVEGITGYSGEAFLSGEIRWDQLIPPGDLSALMEFDHRKRLQSDPDFLWVREYRIMRKDGEVRWVHDSLQGLPSKTGMPPKAKGFLHDITESRKMETELRESEKKFHDLVESTSDWIWEVDAQERYTYCSDAVTNVLGYTAEEIVGKSPFDFMPEEEAARVGELFAGIVAEKQRIVNLEVWNLSKGGRKVCLLRNGFPILDEDGELIGYRGADSDITKRIQAENELLAANKKLEEESRRSAELAVEAQAASAAKSEFLAKMSHEIRTPMNGVIGMAELLMDMGLNDQQRDCVETVRTSGEALLTIINDLLDFSKAEAGKLNLDVMDFDLRATLEDLSALLAVKAQQKGLELVNLVDPEVPALVRGDPGRLRQVLTNLIGNAVKFSDEGEVSVMVSVEEEDAERVTLRFSVRDQGIGIPEDKRGRLFQPFEQVDGSLVRQFGGTGLGLSISKLLVELMDGDIGFESQAGKGSEFWFTAVLGKRERVEEIPAQEPGELEGKRVLVVDDNRINRLLVSRLLHSWGCRGDEAADGPSALSKLQAAAAEDDPFDLAIVDMQMPRMDGETLQRKIKLDPDLAGGPPLIMLTSLGIRGDAARLEESGFAAYLTKPVRRAHLFDALVSVINRTASGTGTERPPIITRHSAAEERKARARILLVEDNPTNQKVASLMLGKLGYRLDTAGNGIEAIQKLEVEDFSLVLMDLQMPLMGGYEATAVIRDPSSSVRNHAIPIVAMTAHALKSDQEKCLDAGMDDYVSKPVRAQVLEEVLRRLLDAEVPKGSAETAEAAQTVVAAQTPGSEERGSAGLEEYPIWDRQALVDRVDGDEESAREIVEVFLEDIPRQIEGLRESIRGLDPGRMLRIVHTIKGAAGSLGAEALAHAARRLEESGHGGNPDSQAAALDRLEAEFHRLRAEMRAPQPRVE